MCVHGVSRAGQAAKRFDHWTQYANLPAKMSGCCSRCTVAKQGREASASAKDWSTIKVMCYVD